MTMSSPTPDPLTAILARLDAIEAALRPGADAGDVWADGGWTQDRAAEHLGVSGRSVFTVARKLGWPSKLVKVPGSRQGRRVYPARLVREFLAACRGD